MSVGGLSLRRSDPGGLLRAVTSEKTESDRILVVDDDPRIRQMLTRYLEEEGFQVRTAENGAAMRAQMATFAADVVLLDLVMPGEDGLSLARELRARSDVGIIMLTGRGDIVDRVAGLEVGADDYVTKPFHLREVLARIRTILRRTRARPAAGGAAIQEQAGRGEDINFDGWKLSLSRRELLSPAGEAVHLTTGEFDLLVAFTNNPNQVLDRDHLMNLIKGQEWSAFDRSIDTQVSRLRKKIERDPANPTLIKSVRGVGYILTAAVTRL